MASNYGGNLGQPRQNSISPVGVGNPGGIQGPMLGQQQSMNTLHNSTPMDIDSTSGHSSVMSHHTHTTNMSNMNSMPSPGLGNLQSVVGNSITTSTTAQSPLQGGGNNTGGGSNAANSSSSISGPSASMRSSAGIVPGINEILTRPRLQDLVREIDPTEQLDEEVEELLLQLADDFVETTVGAACLLAKHRKGNTVEVKDVQLHLGESHTIPVGTAELLSWMDAVDAHCLLPQYLFRTLRSFSTPHSVP
uniref:Transcription initiation factor TFIID subunit 12 n=1 Tax=Timema shepardi TaxID=629360 RepID=A0A7R9B963_TIMSH|nr:unnamed protein product [Timema shepardi]